MDELQARGAPRTRQGNHPESCRRGRFVRLLGRPVGKTYEELWRHRLRLAVPNAAITRKDLTQPMRSIQAFRKRVAHHDCLLNQPVRDRYNEMIRISGWIDADAAPWLERQSDVVSLLASKP